MTKQRITVNVTAEHIAKGARNSACYCPIALAVKDLGYPLVGVGTSFIRFGKNDYSWDSIGSDLPTSAQEFIFDFDFRNTVEPFTFRLEFDS